MCILSLLYVEFFPTYFQMDTIKDEQRLRKHFDEFFDDTTKRNRTVSHERSRPPLDKSQKDEENVLEQNNRFERGTTPGRTLVTNLKPAPRKSDVFELNKEPKCDLKQHFKSFMSSTSTCKRARSFSQPRVVENEDNKNSSSEREVPPPLPTSAIATSSQKQSKPSSSFPARKVSRQTDEREKWLQDGVQSEKASRRPSRSVIRGEAKPPSESSGSERTSATDDILEDKPVLEDFDNKGKKAENTFIVSACISIVFCLQIMTMTIPRPREGLRKSQLVPAFNNR